MKAKRKCQTVTVQVSGGHGVATVGVQGEVGQISIVPPANAAVYDVAVSYQGHGNMGRTGLGGQSTVCEVFTCLSGSSVEIQNASTDGTYSLCLFGDLE